jgi:hypothetical protein
MGSLPVGYDPMIQTAEILWESYESKEPLAQKLKPYQFHIKQ